MTTHPADIRCPGTHPDGLPGPCNGLLTRAVPGTVEVRSGGDIPPGCNEVYCKRCKTRYVVCARAA